MRHYFLPTAIVASVLALIFPQVFVWWKTWIPYLLGIIMFGMGLTLKAEDFGYVWKNKRSVFIGVAAQYTIMPVLALVISKLLGFRDAILIGMVLVGSCPGGTASNVMVYLAKGNVALSVTMTLISTLLAPLLTPLIVSLFVNQIVDVPFFKMMTTVFWIIIFPIAGGLVVNHCLKAKNRIIHKIVPHISMITIIFVIAVIMALNKNTLLSFPILIAAGVMLHNGFGLLLGYGAGSLLKCSEEDKRAIAIEVGMQNSGLAVSLATQFFQAQSALPGALFSLWHNISGATLSRFWSARASKR